MRCILCARHSHASQFARSAIVCLTPEVIPDVLFVFVMPSEFRPAEFRPAEFTVWSTNKGSARIVCECEDESEVVILF